MAMWDMVCVDCAAQGFNRFPLNCACSWEQTNVMVSRVWDISGAARRHLIFMHMKRGHETNGFIWRISCLLILHLIFYIYEL